MIQKILRMLPNNLSPRTAANSRGEIIRRWVETADERCPLACVWFALPEIGVDQDDESDLPRPAFYLFCPKAGFLLSIHTRPAPSMLAQYLKNQANTIAALLLLTISLVASAQEQDVVDGRPSRPAIELK